MTERSWADWLDGNVSEEELAEAEATIEAAAAKARQEAAQRQKPPPDAPDAPEAGEAAHVPPEVRPECRVDPIFPVVSVREPPARDAGRLAFGGIVEERKSLPAQLPLLPAPEGPRVPILELSDWRGVPTMAKGRGAPLDLRLAVGACVLTPHAARAARGRLAVTVRELRDFLFPNGWERRRDWPRVREALYRARDYVLPIGRGNWLPFALRWEPGKDAELDELVLIDVELPPGSAHGPVINQRELVRLGVRSAPKFRAYIAAHSVAWRPGITRRRHPRNRSVHLWSANPVHYPVLTAQDRRRLAFGAGDKGKRTRARQDAAWEDLPGIEILTRDASTPDGQRGWLLVPEEAAEVIRKGDPSREETD